MVQAIRDIIGQSDVRTMRSDIGSSWMKQTANASATHSRSIWRMSAWPISPTHRPHDQIVSVNLYFCNFWQSTTPTLGLQVVFRYFLYLQKMYAIRVIPTNLALSCPQWWLHCFALVRCIQSRVQQGCCFSALFLGTAKLSCAVQYSEYRKQMGKEQQSGLQAGRGRCLKVLQVNLPCGTTSLSTTLARRTCSIDEIFQDIASQDQI